MDIGCSTGKLTKRIIEENFPHKKNVFYEGIEFAEGFKEDLSKRSKEIFAMTGKSDFPVVSFQEKDIRDHSWSRNYSFITSIFTLQFMPKKDRKAVIEKIYDGLNIGGAYIFAEKIYTENAFIQDMLTFNYYDFKGQKFNYDDIMGKEQTLRHMLKPNTWKEIEDMLMDAGFKSVQVFWQNFLFLGAIAIK
jgi:tRNA (cmo5U34)-methyltransferase